MWYLELQKSDFDVQSPSLECISAQSMEINRLGETNMLMDEDGSENNQVKVATLLVSQLFSCWQNQGVTKDSSLFVKGKRERGEEGGRKRREENDMDSEKKKKETEDGEQERETQRGAGEQS
jgi:hypothetical protein